MQHSYDPNGDLSPTVFFFSLKNAKEDCLLLSAEHGGKVKFHGSIPAADEDLPPTLESDCVLDWLDSIGGAKPVDQTFRVFAKELETESLADLRRRISDNLTSLLSESDQQAEFGRALVSNGYQHPPNQKRRRYTQPPSPYSQPPPAGPTPRSTPRLNPPSQATTPGQTLTGPPCKLCLATKPNIAHTHSSKPPQKTLSLKSHLMAAYPTKTKRHS